VIAVRNAGEFLDAVPQKLAPLGGIIFEVVIVDDGSKDDTWSILTSWTMDNLTLISSSESVGVAEARNLALRNCRGDYVWFIDPDDSWAADTIPLLVELLDQDLTDVAIANATKIDSVTGTVIEEVRDAPANAKISSDAAFDALLRGRIQGHLWNKVIRREALVSDPFPSTRRHSDLGGMLRLFSTISGASTIDREVYEYHIHAGSHLQSSGYVWTDLPDILDLAKGLATGRHPRAISVFARKLVFVPLAHQLMQRGREVEGFNEARSYLSSMTFSTASTVRELGGKSALQIILIRRLWPIYRWIYLAHRKRKWGNAA
jgi:glycosyltransferase involved in cell wall biosynthesis